MLGIIFIAAVPSPPPEVDTGVPISSPTPVLTYQDSEYANWAANTFSSITLDANLLANVEDIKAYSGILYDDAKKALDEIDQFDVSPALKPSKDEFKLALQDFKQSGYYGKKGARNKDVDDIETSADYAESAVRHAERTADLLPKE